MDQRQALLFPGQGTQYVGMGRTLHDRFEVVRKTFAEADEALAFPLTEMVFSGPQEDLDRLENTQPAILTYSVACFRILKELGLASPAMAAGHSIGEYAALVATGALPFEIALRLVRLRGQLLQEAVFAGQGGMMAVVGLPPAKVEIACLHTSKKTGKVVEIAAIDDRQQVVISGETEALELARTRLESSGGRAYALPVEAPLHSSLMKPAAERFAEALSDIEFKAPEFPYVANVTAKPKLHARGIAELLLQQLYQPVRWHESLLTMLSLGANAFVEAGPKRTLAQLAKRLYGYFPVASIDDEERRRYPRVRVELPCTVGNAAGETIEGTINDISIAGMKLTTGSKCAEEGELIEVCIKPEGEDEEALRAQCRVIWQEGGTLLGLSVEQADQAIVSYMTALLDRNLGIRGLARRAHPRIYYRVPIWFDDQRRRGTGVVTDISLGGAGVDLDSTARFEVGQPITIALPTDADSTLELVGKIRRSRPRDDVTVHLGVEFDSLAPELKRRLRRFLERATSDGSSSSR